MNDKSIYDLEINESLKIEGSEYFTEILRVPGGFIYSGMNKVVHVPISEIKVEIPDNPIIIKEDIEGGSKRKTKASSVASSKTAKPPAKDTIDPDEISKEGQKEDVETSTDEPTQEHIQDDDTNTSDEPQEDNAPDNEDPNNDPQSGEDESEGTQEYDEW